MTFTFFIKLDERQIILTECRVRIKRQKITDFIIHVIWFKVVIHTIFITKSENMKSKN